MLRSMCYKVLDHLPYCPNLSLCDVNVFSFFKKVLKDQRFGLGKDKAMVVQ
jgi:hypothetical protein